MDLQADPQTFARALARRARDVRTLQRRPWWKFWGQESSEPQVGAWVDRQAGPYEREGWRIREVWASEHETAFCVEYFVCGICRSAWVEQPYTPEPYQRCGLARAALAALRVAHPGVTWGTLGGHFRESRPFWKAVGKDVEGGYQQRELCEHAAKASGRTEAQ